MAVLDGWGIAPDGSAGNAIRKAKTPNMDAFRKAYPSTELEAHGRYVGLLPHQEGNSEAGHINIGAGRIVRQDIIHVTEAIKDRTFFKNTAFREALKHVKKYDSRVHIMGMLSNGNSAHASPDHLHALLQLMDSEGVKEVYLHLFTDGRDAPPFIATRLLHELEDHMLPNYRIATIMGRFYSMDRNKLWHRTEKAYRAIVCGEGLVAPDAHTAILRGYNRGESDEFILPTVITDKKYRPIGQLRDHDVMFFFNLRSDRARQLAKCFVQPDFEEKNENSFTRHRVPKSTRFVAMTDFGPDLKHMFTAFLSHDVTDGLTETLARTRQFYIAESEKYAHVTYFFNGGYADPLRGEERMRVPSANIPHYDDLPEMRAKIITDEVIRRLNGGLHDFVCMNYANVDMVAHTGDMDATVQAVEYVDAELGRLVEALKKHKGCLVIVSDHGNAERMVNTETGETITEHTVNPVPFMIIGDAFKGKKVSDGILADVAPTILDIMDIPKPELMSGFSLLRS